MKACVISTPVFSTGRTGARGYAGLEHIAWLQAKGLAAKGHQVALVAPDGSECPGVTMMHVGPERRTSEDVAYGTYWQELPKFDVVIDHSWGKYSYLLKAEGRLPAPVLGIMHAPINTMISSLPPVEKPCIVCISHDQAAHFEALHSRAAKVCHNGLDLDFYQPTGVPRSGRFLFLARFSSIKGPRLAIEACKRVNADLDLVGDTQITGEPEYLKQCLAQADGHHVRFVGGVTRGEAVGWFSQAHVMLHPNRDFREPFGLAPVEAMACGVPIVAWNNGAMRETVIHGETGWLVNSVRELTDAVAATKDGIDPVMRTRCRENAARFDVRHMIDRIEQLCEEAIGGGW